MEDEKYLKLLEEIRKLILEIKELKENKQDNFFKSPHSIFIKGSPDSYYGQTINFL